MSDAKDAGHPVVALNNFGWPTGPLTECVFERGGLHRFEECYAQWTYFLAHRIARLNPFRRIPFG